MSPTLAAPLPRQRIAIVGTGISGLGAAYLLQPHHDIVVYEKNAYLGGHSRTVEVATPEGKVAVDTGFIVFNARNYPHLTSLFRKLDVPTTSSDMSFGASIDGGWMEYGTQGLANVFAQKRNLLRPQFWRMLADIPRFYRRAPAYLEQAPEVSLAQCLEELGMGEWFRDYFMLAMGGAIWSTPLTDMAQFPATTFVRFFENHGLLALSGQPQWYTVTGGSREYVKRLSASFHSQVRLNAGVRRVVRSGGKVIVETVHGDCDTFDQVVLACHGNEALALIDQPTAQEHAVLGAFRYQPNRAVLHSDLRFMPKHRKAWSSWVYLTQGRHDQQPAVSLSYWMNNLQPLKTRTPLLVTLNPGFEPRAELVYDDHLFDHPLFDAAAIRAQAQIEHLQGQQGLWYCGAYQRYGFHEDGLGSAVNMAARMGIAPRW